MTNYGHAAELQRGQSPESQLAFLVSELGRWAKLNPGLVDLWSEFSRVSRELVHPDPNAGRCPGPGGCFPDEPCSYRADDCAAR